MQDPHHLTKLGFEDLVFYIRKEAVAFKIADEKAVWEEIQVETFRRIMVFSQAEGFMIDHVYFMHFVNGTQFDDNGESDVYLFRKFVEIVDDLYIHNQLPYLTQKLYGIWNKEFGE